VKIIILGAGQVGRTAAYHLSREEANDVTVVDTNEEILRDLQDRLDIRTVNGNASSPRILEAAGIASTDILVALTNSDEVNMLACQIAWTLYRTPKKIARVRSADYTERDKLFGENGVAVDVWISPEQLVTEYVARLIRYPGALQVLDFADGRVRLVGIRALQGGPLVGQALRTCANTCPTADARVAAIYRAGKSIKPEGETVIEDGDEVFLPRGARGHSRGHEGNAPRGSAGAPRGHRGRRQYRLPAGQRAREDKNQVKLIERDQRRARRVSEQLNRTIVLHGDAADEELLLEENIDSADVFAALTNSEEANILSAMLAKRLGAHKVMALINKPSYAELIESGSIDVAISPQTVTIGSLLAHVRRGDVVRVHSLRRGAAEALEVVVHGDADSSPRSSAAHRGHRAARGHHPGRRGARRRRHHRASRHHRAARRSLDSVPDGPPPHRRRREAVPRLRLLSVKDILLPVAHVFALVMMVFAVTMLAPLVMAVWELDPALWSLHSLGLRDLRSGALLWLATRRFKRELKTRDGLMLVALTWVALPAVAGFPLWQLPAHQFHRRLLRGGVGSHDHGRHGAVGSRIPAALHQSVAPPAELAGRHGHHRARGGHSAHAGCRRHADLSRRNAGPDEGQQADAAHRPDGKAAVGGVRRTHGRLHRVPEVRRHELVRRRVPWILGAGARRLLHLRRQHRAFQFAAHRNGADHIPDPGGAEFRHPLSGLEPARRHGLLSGCRGEGDARRAGGELHRDRLFLYFKGTYPDFPTALRHATFNLVSIATDSGLHTQDYSRWPIFAPMWMIFLSCIVASSGSTGGGIKMIRTLVLAKQAIAS
jgi:trk system potassium uptake protein TrkA